VRQSLVEDERRQQLQGLHEEEPQRVSGDPDASSTWDGHRHTMVALGLIVVLIVQYSLLVRWISKKIDQMTES
jgi:hypothetical protein